MAVVCRSISQQFDMRVSSKWTGRVGDTTTGAFFVPFAGFAGRRC